MSSLLLMLGACSLHLGTPVAGLFRVDSCEAPVAEPGVDVSVLIAVETQLSTKAALAPSGAPLRLTVERADWSPSRRDGEVLVYSAHLRVRMDTTSSARSCDLSAEVLAPGLAELAPGLRAQTFGSLSERCAAQLVAWLVLAPTSGG